MNAQRFIYLILTISVLLFFTACNEAEDSVPTEVATESTLSEQTTSVDIETGSIDFVSTSTEEEATISSLEYTLPEDEIIIENSSTSQEDTSIITYISATDENITTPVVDENITTPVVDENITTPVVDENTTTPVVDENTTTPIVDENTTTPPEEEIVVFIEYTSGFVGKLVDSFVVGVDYTCDGTTSKTDYLGRFNCQTTPVEFSIGNISLGSINNMTDDYLIFPQDLLNIQRGAALHPEVTKMAILFQSLDDDANPNNGIVIKQEVINLLDQEFTLITNIQDISSTQLSLIIQNTINNYLQTNPTSQLQLVASKQAQEHLLTSLSTILISPTQP